MRETDAFVKQNVLHTYRVCNICIDVGTSFFDWIENYFLQSIYRKHARVNEGNCVCVCEYMFSACVCVIVCTRTLYVCILTYPRIVNRFYHRTKDRTKDVFCHTLQWII